MSLSSIVWIGLGDKDLVNDVCHWGSAFKIHSHFFIFGPSLRFKLWALTWSWYHRALIPALERQRKVDLYESAAILFYIVSSRTARTI